MRVPFTAISPTIPIDRPHLCLSFESRPRCFSIDRFVSGIAEYCRFLVLVFCLCSLVLPSACRGLHSKPLLRHLVTISTPLHYWRIIHPNSSRLIPLPPPPPPPLPYQCSTIVFPPPSYSSSSNSSSVGPVSWEWTFLTGHGWQS